MHRRNEVTDTAPSRFNGEEPTVLEVLWLELFVSPLISMHSRCGSIVARRPLPRSPWRVRRRCRPTHLAPAQHVSYPKYVVYSRSYHRNLSIALRTGG